MASSGCFLPLGATGSLSSSYISFNRIDLKEKNRGLRNKGAWSRRLGDATPGPSSRRLNLEWLIYIDVLMCFAYREFPPGWRGYLESGVCVRDARRFLFDSGFGLVSIQKEWHDLSALDELLENLNIQTNKRIGTTYHGMKSIGVVENNGAAAK